MPPKGKKKFMPRQSLRIAELALRDHPKLSFEEALGILTAEFPSPCFQVPAISTLEKMVRANRRAGKESPDERWSLGVSAPAGIPDNSIRIVADVWKHVLLCSGRHITVREAKWIARLKDIVFMSLPDHYLATDKMDALLKWATLYAIRERASLALGLELDTTDIDALLLNVREVVLMAGDQDVNGA